jgi:phage-related protein
MDGPVKTIFSGLGKVFGRLNPILDIITLVIETIKNSPLLRGTLTTILASVVSVLTYLGGIIDSIFGILSPLFGLLGDIIAVSLQPLSIGLQLITFLLSALQGILQPIAEQMRGFTEQMQSVLTFPTTITGALESLGGTPTVIDSLLQNTATSVETNLGEMSESVDGNMEVMKASMKGAFDGDTNGILEVLGTLLGNILTAIVNWISSVDWGEKVQQVATFLAENGPKILKATKGRSKWSL